MLVLQIYIKSIVFQYIDIKDINSYKYVIIIHFLAGNKLVIETFIRLVRINKSVKNKLLKNIDKQLIELG